MLIILKHNKKIDLKIPEFLCDGGVAQMLPDVNYYTIQLTHFTVLKKSERNIIFKFSIDEKEQCKEFLKQRKEAGCNMDKIKIELRIQQDKTNI
jgi:predicted lactoylglutathione lyase